MKINIRVRVPAPRKPDETQADTLRRRLIASTSTPELRRRLADVRRK